MNESDVYREWDPPPEWRHAVTCLWEQRVFADRVQRVVPDGYADLIFNTDDAVDVIGVSDEVGLPVLVAGTRLFGIRLHPEAVGAAFRTNASRLLNEAVPAEDVLGAKRARHLVDQRSLDAWIRTIEPDDRASQAVRLLKTHSVADTADELNVTTRQLQRSLLAEVGLAPKTFQRITRFQRFLRAADGGATLGRAAAESGYADQAHLTREVGRLSGLTPSRLIAERRSRVAITKCRAAREPGNA